MHSTLSTAKAFDYFLTFGINRIKRTIIIQRGYINPQCAKIVYMADMIKNFIGSRCSYGE
jgi:hypothetical protein